ncbi:MAG TPA: hypothetical protein VHN80_25205, partial [Kineosporiaceae bacterium]|nr:hypothetical protein [Kineosporiaceae bacterium]
GTAAERAALVRSLRTAVDRMTSALQYLDDSSGVIGDELRAVMALYARACCAAPPPVKTLATWLVALECDGPGWPQVRLADFAPALGEKGLAVVAALVDERIRGLDEDGWHRQEWAVRDLREQLAQLSGDIDRYVAVLAEHLTHAGRYQQIAQALRQAGRAGEAIDWCRRGLAAHSSDPKADGLRDLLVDLLVDTGAPDAALQERRGEFERRPIVSTYRALVAAAVVGAEPGPIIDWALDALRARVTAEPRHASQLVTVLLAQDRVEEAWTVGLAHRDMLGESDVLTLLALRAATHPQDVVEPYRSLIEQHILDSHDKWRYERALKLLTPLRAAHLALGDAAGFAGYLDELRDVHRIRPTFLRKLADWRG